MDRLIEIKINGSLLTKDNLYAGVQGESNVTALRIEFDESWDGYAKTVVFWNARGENSVKRTLTADLLEDITQSSRIYLCMVPGEPLEEAGECTIIIDGYAEGKRPRSVPAKLKVRPAPDTDRAGEPVDPTPTQAEQLQKQIDNLLGDMQEQAVIAHNAATEAGEHAQAAAFSEGNALQAAADAQAAQRGAEAAKTAAESFVGQAENKALAAAASAQAAEDSAGRAKTSETKAAASALEAYNREQSAMARAQEADAAAERAENARDGVEQAERASAQSASAAATSAANAAKAQKVAEDSASKATTTAQGVEAFVQRAESSAASASTSAGEAERGAFAAATSEINAANSATAASNSANSAAAWTEYAENAAEYTAQARNDVRELERSTVQNAAAAAASATAAQAAQKAAEDARDAASEIAGGDFASKTEAKGYANTAESNANAYTDRQIATIPTPDVSGQIGAHDRDAGSHEDIRSAVAAAQRTADGAASGSEAAQAVANSAHDVADAAREAADAAVKRSGDSMTGTLETPSVKLKDSRIIGYLYAEGGSDRLQLVVIDNTANRTGIMNISPDFITYMGDDGYEHTVVHTGNLAQYMGVAQASLED